MNIRIYRACLGFTLAIVFGTLAACASGPGARNAQTPPNVPPETLLANADAALARGDFPEAARAYREGAQRSDDETIAEQATRVAFDHFQLKESSLAADRWLFLN